jgi:hypothetical protein
MRKISNISMPKEKDFPIIVEWMKKVPYDAVGVYNGQEIRYDVINQQKQEIQNMIDQRVPYYHTEPLIRMLLQHTVALLPQRELKKYLQQYPTYTSTQYVSEVSLGARVKRFVIVCATIGTVSLILGGIIGASLHLNLVITLIASATIMLIFASILVKGN